MSRLTVQLDGKPVYLYFLVQGTHEERCEYLCAHAEDLNRAETVALFREALAKLPAKIEVDYSAPGLDLFEQALELAGFIRIDREVPTTLWLKGLGRPATEKHWIERDLARFEKEHP